MCPASSAWRAALENLDGPTAIVLTRQKLPILSASADAGFDGFRRGAYVASDVDDARMVLIASGSEVALALDAAQELATRGVGARVVSMPSWELFDAQGADYRESVLPAALPHRLAIEAGTPLGWERYVGDQGAIHGVSGYGASAPASDLAPHYGFTVENVVERALALLD